MMTTEVTPMAEVLLTVMAVSQEGYAGPMNRPIPKRLQTTLRRARAAGFVFVDDSGMYLEEEGAAELSRILPGFRRF